MILNPFSVQEMPNLDSQFEPIDPRPSIVCYDREHIFRSGFTMPVQSVNDQGDYELGHAQYHPQPVYDCEGVVNVPVQLGAMPMSQIEAALIADKAVSAIPPTTHEQENL